jgi:hypothetical protein
MLFWGMNSSIYQTVTISKYSELRTAQEVLGRLTHDIVGKSLQHLCQSLSRKSSVVKEHSPFLVDGTLYGI